MLVVLVVLVELVLVELVVLIQGVCLGVHGLQTMRVRANITSQQRWAWWAWRAASERLAFCLT